MCEVDLRSRLGCDWGACPLHLGLGDPGHLHRIIGGIEQMLENWLEELAQLRCVDSYHAVGARR